MSDISKLESFIIENRKAFDDRQAPDHLWERIQGNKPAMVSSVWKYWAIAASVLVLVSAGYFIGFKASSGSTMAGWDQYAKTEEYFTHRVNQKMEEIRALDVSTEVLSDIKLLDDVYQDLKAQLLADPNTDAEILLNTMIKHQQQKLSVMEEILTRVDKYKKQNDEILEM